MTTGRPKLFVEGALGDNAGWERLYKEADIELASSKYLYHSLHDATGSLIGVKTGVSINRGLLQFVLAIPIETLATSESQRMKYNISMHQSLQRLHTEIRYTGRTEGNEREVRVERTRVKKTGASLKLAGSLTIPANTVATSLSLFLDGMRVETVLVEQLPQINTPQEGESMEKTPPTQELESTVAPPKVKVGNENKVFVVHGRDEELRRSIFNFLRCIGLQPMEWGEVLQLVGTPNPSIMEILDGAFSEAQAVLVVLSPDDLAYLRPELQNTSDPPSEKEPTGQARPNVLFEMGLALARNIDRTVVIRVGDIRPISDIAGRHILKLTNSAEDRTGLTDRLKIAGCPIDLTGKKDYFSAGDFRPKHARTVA
jgi:predicted nucleotide-binding protein